MSKNKIERINQLAAKAKTVGLSSDEKEEQKKLREQYIQSVRSSLKSNLFQIKVIDPNGDDVTPVKLKQAKANREKH